MAARTSSKTRLLPLRKSDDADFRKAWLEICTRTHEIPDEAWALAEEAAAAVARGGDDALLARAQELSGVDLAELELSRDDWEEGCETIDAADRAAIGKAAMRVREFHRKRVAASWEMREEGGAYMGQRVRALDRVGIVLPETGAVASDLAMYATPASVVEVPEIVLAAPADAEGRVRPDLLMWAKVSGVHRIVRVAGPWAVAAFAQGTLELPAADKIVGPAQPGIDAAKQLAADRVSVDEPSGVPEVLVVADRSAQAGWIAADLLSVAERRPGARILLVTHVKGLVTRVQDQLARLLKPVKNASTIKKGLARQAVIVQTRSFDESMERANRYAPEHLVLATERPDQHLKAVHNAGTVLMGHYTPFAIAEYLAGPNRVLPTGGRARFASALGVDDFLKRTHFVRFEPPKLRELALDAMRLAELEERPGTAKAVDLRLQKIRRARREREAAREAEADL